jgi:hypothetical protein
VSNIWGTVEGIWNVQDVSNSFSEEKSKLIAVILTEHHTRKAYWGSGGSRVYPKVSGLASWSENCKWYGSLPLGAVLVPVLN